MKRSIRRAVSIGCAWLCCLLPVVAQSGLEVFNPVICKGISVEANGGLYKLSDSYTIVSILAAGSPDELKSERFLRPDQTTEYTILYKEMSSGVQYSQKATIKVKQVPVFSIAIDNPGVMTGNQVCEGTVLKFKVTDNLYNDSIYWNISTEAGSVSGNTADFTMTETCRITAQAVNDYCPIADTSVFITVNRKPDLHAVEPFLQTSVADPICAGCGFFPEIRSVLLGASEGARVDYTQSDITWEDGTRDEVSVTAGTMALRANVRYTVTKSNECGESFRTADTIAMIVLEKGVDCTPVVVPPILSVKPCEAAKVQLRNDYTDLCILQSPLPQPVVLTGAGTLSYTPGDPVYTPDLQEKREVYHWTLDWENYTGGTPPRLQFDIPYTLDCPYSKIRPVLFETFFREMAIVPDTNDLTFRYEYCPDQDAELVISGKQGEVEITEVVFDPAGMAARMEKSGSSTSNRWEYRSKEPVTAVTAADYYQMQLRVRYKMVRGSCELPITQTKVVRLTQQDCSMKFALSSSGACIGEARTLTLSDKDAGIVTDSIVIDRSPVFSVRPGNLQTGEQADRFTFYPYYAGAPQVKSADDSISATVHYHIQGSDQPLFWNKKFRLSVNSCGPEVRQPRIGSDDCPSCPYCPGTRFFARVQFINPTTDTAACKVSWVTDPVSGIFDPVFKRDVLSDQWYFDFKSYFFSETAFRIAVTYNEGDSVYHVPALDISSVQSPFSVDPACRPGIQAERDSCCEEDEIEVFIYSNNPYDVLQHIEWDASCSGRTEPIATEIVERPVEGLSKKGFLYRVQARAPGAYPFRLFSRVRDTVLVYEDTLRLAVAENRRIFIEDTVFVCTGQDLDLRTYIDSAVIRTMVSPPDASGLFLPGISVNRTVRALAEMRYLCADGNMASDSICILTDQQVYLANKASQEVCPGDKIELHAATNGRISWFRQKKLPGGGYSDPDTLYWQLDNDAVRYDQIGTDTVLYTLRAQTACPDPVFSQLAFSVMPKKIPDLRIVDRSACRPDSLALEARFDAAEIDAARTKWLVHGREVTDGKIPPIDSVQIICAIVGLNGCMNSDTAVLYSWPQPPVRIRPKTIDNTYCIRQGESATFLASGAGDYSWQLKNSSAAPVRSNRFVWTGTADTALVLQGSEPVHGCRASDTVYITLYGNQRPNADTIGCRGEEFSLGMPSQAGVEYRWYTPEGDFVCPCPDMAFSSYQLGDTGIYAVEIVRGVCVDTQYVHFGMYPVPRMEFLQDGIYCEGEPLVLEMETGLTADWHRQSRFAWYDPDGGLLQDGSGLDRYTGGPAELNDTGVYRVLLEVDRCLFADSIRIAVDEHSVPAFLLDPFYCEGDPLYLQADDQGERAIYHWFSDSRDLGLSGETEAMLPALSMSDSSLFSLEVLRGVCRDTLQQWLHVRSRPDPFVYTEGGLTDASGMYFCEGMPVVFKVGNLQGNETVGWYFPVGGGLLPGSQNGKYRIDSVGTAHAGWYGFRAERNGCASIPDSVYLDVRLLPDPGVVTDTFLCSGIPLLLDASNGSFPGAAFLWERNGERTATVTVSEGGDYPLEMEYKGCVSRTLVFVEERPLPLVDFPQDTSMCQRDSVLLYGPEGMDSYLWQDGSQERWFLVKEEGLYSLYVEDSGCAVLTEVYVQEEFCSRLYFPSAFTPDGDGVNDVFGALTTATESEVQYSLQVFNREGERVFRTEQLTGFWDGTYKGKACPPGVYVFRCQARTVEDGRDLSQTGTVTLIR